jgi:hypothetical protein
MMESKDKVDLALRASILARDALDFLSIPNKAVAKLSMARLVSRVRDLDKAIDALPDDRP